MTIPSQATSSSQFLRISAVLVAAGTITQAVLGLITAFGNTSVLGFHSIVAYATTVFAVLAAVAGFLWWRKSRNSGVLGHTLSLPVLALAQIALGEMGLEGIHIGVGFLFLVAAVSLVPIAFKRA